MSHYKPYLEYKDSGALWLGALPEKWKHCSLKWISRRYAGGTPDKTVEAYWDNGTIPWLASGEVNQRLITKPSTLITEDAYENSSAKWIPSGALVMALAGQGRTRGTVAQLAIESTCNQSMAAIVATKAAPRFLYWWLDSNYSNLRGLSGDDVRDGLNLEVLGNIPCPHPGEGEQLAIAAHLDRETARIDGLASKKTRFIELLREKRQALITHAVTKGLDPNVRMKDSGVEWLGQVPVHWRVKKLKYLCKIQTGDKDTVNAEDEGQYPFFVRSQTIERINSYTENCEAVLTAGDGVGVGKVFHYFEGKFDFHQRVYMLNRFSEISGRFFFYYLQCNFHKVALDGGAKSTVDSLRLPVFLNFQMTVPPLEEQVLILDFIEKNATRIDTLISKTERSIELLKERRGALITAAVTGQIDLREAA